MDERLQIIFSRRSIRQYTDQPVSEADLASLLEAGMAAPSAMNKRPWHRSKPAPGSLDASTTATSHSEERHCSICRR